jgi:hypothetical protein
VERETASANVVLVMAVAAGLTALVTRKPLPTIAAALIGGLAAQTVMGRPPMRVYVWAVMKNGKTQILTSPAVLTEQEGETLARRLPAGAVRFEFDGRRWEPSPKRRR